ncbi:hypothetical protein [Burkholderia gladioli]|uniref:hypothetical protein n=1 Tax=Burkholderia gladioli TaxID=28095 RepID=UPI00164178A2|nr:hypothetical protein [Burkholderia gladioli]
MDKIHRFENFPFTYQSKQVYFRGKILSLLPVSFACGNGPGSPFRQSILFVEGMENHAGHELSALRSIPDIATVLFAAAGPRNGFRFDQFAGQYQNENRRPDFSGGALWLKVSGRLKMDKCSITLRR